MHPLPSIGFGTFRLESNDAGTGEAYDAVSCALDCGYRLLDTAQFYANEQAIGKAVADSGLRREDVFITTKVWHEQLGKKDFRPSVEKSLEKLQSDYIDLLLIHWPSPNHQVPLHEYLEALQQTQDAGLTRHIGVSNFTIDLLEQSMNILNPGDIITNQVEFHPHFQNKKLIEFCQQHNIRVTAYLPLAAGQIMRDPIVSDIAERYDESIASIVLSWIMAKGIVAIPSSSNPEHIRQNFKSTQLMLDEKDVMALDQLNRNTRMIDPDFAPDWD